MGNPVIRLKRSNFPGKIPTTGDLELGELAINTNDGKLYTKKDDGVESIVEIGAPGIKRQIFTGDGVTIQFTVTDFTLNNNFVVFMGGTLLMEGYVRAQQHVIFTYAPPDGTTIVIMN